MRLVCVPMKRVFLLWIEIMKGLYKAQVYNVFGVRLVLG